MIFLSPACISSFVITATVRGELKAAWGWSDESDEKTSTTTRLEGAKATVLSGNGGDLAFVDSQTPQEAKKEKTSGSVVGI
jgi:minor histocompatibility antigen H13